eukprot:481499-Amphidinium_carterae.1
MGVVKGPRTGFSVVGDIGALSELVPCVRQAAMSLKELEAHGTKVRRAIAGKRPSLQEQDEEALWQETLREVVEGNLEDPSMRVKFPAISIHRLGCLLCVLRLSRSPNCALLTTFRGPWSMPNSVV